MLREGDTLVVWKLDRLGRSVKQLVDMVKLGSQTFGKTGTNTVVLFLRRKAQRPERAVQFKNRVNNFFADWENEKASSGGAYLDTKVVEKYCQHTQIDFALYETLLKGELNADLLAVEIFKDYQTDFNKQAEIVNLKKQKQFKAKIETEQQAELDKRLLQYVINIEKDKLYYFMLTQYNAMLDNKARALLVVKSPSDNKEQKKFLGYEWSSAKGNEGLSYMGGETVFDINTPLFDPKNRENTEKISYVIRQNFNGEQVNIPEHLTPFVSQVYLHDVLDFSRKEFNKAFNLSAQSKVEIETKWDLFKLETLMKIVRGASPRPISKYLTTEENGVNWIKIGDISSGEKYLVKTEEKITQEGANQSRMIKVGDFILSNSMSFGRPYISKIDGCIHDGWLLLSDFDKNLKPDYLYEILSSQIVQSQFQAKAAGGVVSNLNTERVKSVKIPLPPLDIQQKIVKECEAVDKQMEHAQLLIAKITNDISSIIQNVEGHRIKIGSLYTYSNMRIHTDLLNADNYVGVDNLLPNTKGKKASEFVPNSGAVTQYDIGDVLLSNIRPYLKKIWLANTVGGASNDVLVLKKQSENISEKYFFYNLKQDQFFEYSMLGKKGVKMPRGDKNQILDYQIPVPPLAEQEKIVQQIEALEAQIAQAQQVIDDAPQQKQAILQNYL